MPMSTDKNKVSDNTDSTNQRQHDSESQNEPIDKNYGWKDYISSKLKSEKASTPVIVALAIPPVIEIIGLVYRSIKKKPVPSIACILLILACSIFIYILYKTWKAEASIKQLRQDYRTYIWTILVHVIYLVILSALSLILFFRNPEPVSIELVYLLILLAEAICIIVLYSKRNPRDDRRWFVRTNFYVIIGALFSVILAITQLFFAGSLNDASASWAFGAVATLITFTYMKQIYDEKIYPPKRQ